MIETIVACSGQKVGILTTWWFTYKFDLIYVLLLSVFMTSIYQKKWLYGYMVLIVISVICLYLITLSARKRIAYVWFLKCWIIPLKFITLTFTLLNWCIIRNDFLQWKDHVYFCQDAALMNEYLWTGSEVICSQWNIYKPSSEETRAEIPFLHHLVFNNHLFNRVEGWKDADSL